MNKINKEIEKTVENNNGVKFIIGLLITNGIIFDASEYDADSVKKCINEAEAYYEKLKG